VTDIVMSSATASRFLAAALLFCATTAGATPRNAATCGQADVATAIGQAVAGDTINIPAGVCNWNSQLDVTLPANVILQGAGTTAVGGGNITIIQDNWASDQPLIRLDLGATGTTTVQKFTVRKGTGAAKWNGTVNISGGGAKLVLGYFTLNMQSGTADNSPALRLNGWVRGVAHNISLLLNSVGNGIQIWYDAHSGVGLYGDKSWNAATAFGTDDFFYIEDSTLSGNNDLGAANDCDSGGKFVARYNTISLVMLQTHPLGGGNRIRGCRAWEIYGNTFTGGSNSQQGMWASSGTGIKWGNTTTGYKYDLKALSMRSDNSTYSQTATPNGWGYCGTAFNSTGSNWDENQSASTGYACMDMPGRGVGDLISGEFPNITNSTRGCISSQACAWPRQATEPIYEWNNAWSCPACGGAKFANQHPSVLNANRDYFLETGSFTGATGVGVGTRASRPATCTTGVAYWSTDQGGNWSSAGGANDGTLDKCTATNTWTNGFYTPYTYPHPLRSGGGLLAPPTNLLWAPR
jgi:hypothetical protein